MVTDSKRSDLDDPGRLKFKWIPAHLDGQDDKTRDKRDKAIREGITSQCHILGNSLADEAAKAGAVCRDLPIDTINLAHDCEHLAALV